MDITTDAAQAARMGQDLLMEMAWKRMLTQEGSALGKGPMGSLQADWLAQNLAQELGGQLGKQTEVGHGA